MQLVWDQSRVKKADGSTGGFSPLASLSAADWQTWLPESTSECAGQSSEMGGWVLLDRAWASINPRLGRMIFRKREQGWSKKGKGG